MIEKVQQLMNPREIRVIEEMEAVHAHFAKEG